MHHGLLAGIEGAANAGCKGRLELRLELWLCTLVIITNLHASLVFKVYRITEKSSV
jgi:hypothetical protein